MPDAKKISELPEFSTVAANDILPIVDENRTGTGHCKASQISLLGGGPPGDSTVLERHMTLGAVTAPHAGFTAREKIIASTIGSQQGTPNGSNYRGEEITCTNYIQALFSKATAQEAREHLNALQSSDNPTFTGQVRLASGSPDAPSLTHSGDLDTGIYFATDLVAISTNGLPRFAVDSSGNIYFTMVDNGNLRRATFVRAQAVLDAVPAVPAITGNWGIASVTRPVSPSNGIYTIAFTEAMPDTNYTVSVSTNESIELGDNGTSPGNAVAANIMWVGNKTVNGFGLQLRQWDWNGGNPRWIFSDASAINISVFR